MKLWDTESGRERRALTGHGDLVSSVTFTAGGELLATGSFDDTIKLWEVEDGRELETLGGQSGVVTSVVFSPDGRTLASGGTDRSIELWGVQTLRRLDVLGGQTTRRPQRSVSERRRRHSAREDTPSGSGATSVNASDEAVIGAGLQAERLKGSLVGTTLRTGAFGNQAATAGINVIASREQTDVFLAFSPDGRALASSGPRHTIELWDVARNHELDSLWHDAPVRALAFSPDGRTLASAGWNHIKLWNVARGRVSKTLAHPSAALAFGPYGERLASGDAEGVIKLWDVETGHERHEVRGHGGSVYSVAFSPDGRVLASGGHDTTIRLYDVPGGREARTLSGHTHFVSSVDFSPDGSILASGSYDGTIKLWEVSTGRLLGTLRGHRSSVHSVAFSPDGRILASGGGDNRTRLWNLEGDSAVNLRSTGHDWLVYTDDGDFSASPDGADLVHAVQGLRTFGIDQLALEKNRPDIILERLGSENQELIAHYEAQWRKRLKKAGLTEADLTDDVDLPDARILRARELDETPGVAEIIFEFRDAVGLKRYQVYVDNVPLFADGGIEISGERVQLRHEVQLTDGANKIEVSALNTRGQESLRADRMLRYSDPEKGDLYFVGFGVSDYAHDEIPDLTYAHKDAEDLEALLARADETFDDVHVHSFTNDEVTFDAIEAAQAILDATEPRDTVVLFVAGHGMYDDTEAPTYYYLTHDAKLDDLENTAASFESIESLLDGIPARNKLFLIDTCQSGESTEPVDIAADASGASRGLRARAIPRASLVSSTGTRAPRPWLHERDRFIYRDLRRRTGAIVFSSSLGSEYSWESKRYENGAFTEAIVEALTGRAAITRAGADTTATKTELRSPDSGLVSTGALREYVRNRVPELTDDKQHPTVDRDNIHRAFVLPVFNR